MAAILGKVLDRLEEWLIALLMGGATLVIFVAVVHRYASTVPIPVVQDWLLALNLSWAQELCIYLFIWMAKFGAAYGVRTGIHVGVDVLVLRLAPERQRAVVLFGLACGMLFTAIVGALGAMFVWEIAATGQVSADLGLPMWIVYLAVPLGSWLMCFRFIQVAVAFLRGVKLPHHDHAEVEGIEEPGLAPVTPAAARR